LKVLELPKGVGMVYGYKVASISHPSTLGKYQKEINKNSSSGKTLDVLQQGIQYTIRISN